MGEKKQANEENERRYQNCGIGWKIRSLLSKWVVHKAALFLECFFAFPFNLLYSRCIQLGSPNTGLSSAGSRFKIHDSLLKNTKKAQFTSNVVVR